MDMNCDELVELITAYLDGALDADTLRRFEAHLALCDGCDRYLDQFRETVDLVGAAGAREELPAAAREDLLAAFRDWHGSR